MKKAIKTAVLLLLCAALLLTGCAKAPNEPAVEEKETAPFMADYELLWLFNLIPISHKRLIPPLFIIS